MKGRKLSRFSSAVVRRRGKRLRFRCVFVNLGSGSRSSLSSSRLQKGLPRDIHATAGLGLQQLAAPSIEPADCGGATSAARRIAASAGKKAAIIADFDKLNGSASWQKTLADKGWANTYLAGDAFSEQLKKDTEATAAILKDIGLVK